MSTTSPALFSELFGGAPLFVREFLHSALHLRDLQELYSEARVRTGIPLSESLLQSLNIDLQVTAQDLERIPKAGPLVVVSNHPFGLLDGIILDSVLHRVRPDIRILTNSLVCDIEELRERVLPIEVFGGAGALNTNVRCLRRVLQALASGGGIAFFPAGEVSHWRKEYKRISDPPWSSVAVRASVRSGAPVVPVFFTGENSLGFQVAGFIHPRLRTARLPLELLNKRGRTIDVRIGNPVTAAELKTFQSFETATDYVRARTYMLSHRKTVCSTPRVSVLHRPKPQEPVAGGTSGVEDEIQLLAKTGRMVLDHEKYSVFAAQGETVPAIVHEIGRLRELTFRAVGEGTGKARDIDRFDSYYHQLVLWHKQTRSIAGAYRLAWTADVLPMSGIRGLYTSSLFRYQARFFSHLGPAVELGRSFVRAEFQKEYAPLFLLWQAIARFVGKRPESPVLFGGVSISADYSQASRELIVRFVSKHSFRTDLASLVVPRRPFRCRVNHRFEFGVLSGCLDNLEALSAPLKDLDDNSGVPVLLRQYAKLGGQVAGFNVDRQFSGALDCLLIVDLRRTDPKVLSRYMGTELAQSFQREACAIADQKISLSAN